MTSGRDILRLIDSALRETREQIQSFEGRADKASNNLVELRARENQIYRELATLRIDDLKDQSFPARLDAADKKAQKLLTQRRAAQHELVEQSQGAEEQLSQLENARNEQLTAVETRENELQKKLDEIHELLARDNTYRDQQKATQEAIETLQAAEEKASLSEQEQDEKGKPFREDPLFQYLWKRNYGKSSYQANLIARFFDRLLAKHIRYEANRQTYHLLQEIPRRLRDHTEALKTKTDAQIDALAATEREFEEAQGIQPFELALEAEEKKLAELDDQITQAEERYHKILAEHAKFAAGEDNYYKTALQGLVENFRAEPIPQLQREASLTEGLEDDTLVSQLGELRRDYAALEDSIAQQQSVHQQYARRLNELNDVRHQFKSYRYDAMNSQFSDGRLIENLIQEFTRGLISDKRLWQGIEQNQRFVRYRTGPAISRQGYPHDMRLPGGIRFPKTRRIPRGIRFPGGLGGGGGWGGRSSGGWGGGGSSGGGGFRTGGGF